MIFFSNLIYNSDAGVNFAVQKGVQISRSIIRTFKHNDMEDLERVLNDIDTEHIVVSLFDIRLFQPSNFTLYSTRNV